MHVTFAVRQITEVVTDVLASARDPDSYSVVAQNPEPVTRCPWALMVAAADERCADERFDASADDIAPSDTTYARCASVGSKPLARLDIAVTLRRADARALLRL
jgi:hypothetical protein